MSRALGSLFLGSQPKPPIIGTEDLESIEKSSRQFQDAKAMETVESPDTHFPKGNGAHVSAKSMPSSRIEDTRRQKGMFAEQIWKAHGRISA